MKINNVDNVKIVNNIDTDSIRDLLSTTIDDLLLAGGISETGQKRFIKKQDDLFVKIMIASILCGFLTAFVLYALIFFIQIKYSPIWSLSKNTMSLIIAALSVGAFIFDYIFLHQILMKRLLSHHDKFVKKILNQMIDSIPSSKDFQRMHPIMQNNEIDHIIDIIEIILRNIEINKNKNEYELKMQFYKLKTRLADFEILNDSQIIEMNYDTELCALYVVVENDEHYIQHKMPCQKSQLIGAEQSELHFRTWDAPKLCLAPKTRPI